MAEDTLKDISKYIGETTEYDKKQEVEHRKVKSWLKSVSAFANGEGGCLLFGIADDDTIVGLADAKRDAEFISQKIKERIDPVPQINMKIELVDGKDILILHVLSGNDTPYYMDEELASLSGKGLRTIKRHIAKMPHIVYVGSGYSGHWEVKKKK